MLLRISSVPAVLTLANRVAHHVDWLEQFFGIPDSFFQEKVLPVMQERCYRHIFSTALTVCSSRCVTDFLFKTAACVGLMLNFSNQSVGACSLCVGLLMMWMPRFLDFSTTSTSHRWCILPLPFEVSQHLFCLIHVQKEIPPVVQH